MKNHKNKINRVLIVLSKAERIAVISLLVIIALLFAFSVFRPTLHFSKEDEWAFHNLDSLIALREKDMREQHPESASSQEDTAMSVDHPTVVPLDSKKNSGAKTTSKKKTSDAPSKDNSPRTLPPKPPTLELNTTDSIALVALPQIGEVMASRIHRYRDRLGGFVCYEQLFEIKGMDSARFTTITPYLLLDTSNIRKLEVNRDEFKTLLRHPYLEYEQVKAIVNHRERKGLIRNWEQLQGIVGEVNPMLERYVRFD